MGYEMNRAKWFLVGGVGLAILISTVFLWQKSVVTSASSELGETVLAKKYLIDSGSEKSGATVADAWQWQQQPLVDSDAIVHGSSKSKPSYTTSEQKIYQALGDVRLDANGHVIIDAVGLQALYKTIGYGNQLLDNDKIEYLKMVIRRGLPGAAGDDVAEIVANFYGYLDAKNQMKSMYPSMSSIEDLSVQIAELRSLREIYFGSDVAALLFKEQQAHEDYMLENMEISNSDSLTEEEKDVARKQLREQLLADRPDVVNWEQRYDIFLRDKQVVLESDLLPLEKKQQVDALVQQQFTSEELSKIGHLDLAGY